MSAADVRVKTILSVGPVGKLPAPRPVVAGWGPTISYRGKLFPFRILVCEKEIQPGEAGEAIVGVIAVPPNECDMEVGDNFDLKDGFLNLIATATVIDVIGEGRDPFDE